MTATAEHRASRIHPKEVRPKPEETPETKKERYLRELHTLNDAITVIGSRDTRQGFSHQCLEAIAEWQTVITALKNCSFLRLNHLEPYLNPLRRTVKEAIANTAIQPTSERPFKEKIAAVDATGVHAITTCVALRESLPLINKKLLEIGTRSPARDLNPKQTTQERSKLEADAQSLLKILVNQWPRCYTTLQGLLSSSESSDSQTYSQMFD